MRIMNGGCDLRCIPSARPGDYLLPRSRGERRRGPRYRRDVGRSRIVHTGEWLIRPVRTSKPHPALGWRGRVPKSCSAIPRFAMDRLNQITTFVRVVELRGFAAAARDLKLAPSVVTTQIQSLEQRLGVRLLNRNTRSVKPTEVGEAYYQRCLDLLKRF